MFLTDKACLLKRSAKGERSQLMVFFLRENGLRYVMGFTSRSGKVQSSLPGILESGTLTIELKNPSAPAWFREFSVEADHAPIGDSYARLKAASRIGRFLERNLVHMEHFTVAWHVLHKALDSLCSGSSPEVVQLKAWFALARSEGYPVTTHWLQANPPGQRNDLVRILKQPAGSVEVDPPLVGRWLADLETFMVRETDLLPPEG